MRLLLALALLLIPSLTSARTQGEMVPIKAGEPVTIRADRAYLLFRTVRPEGVESIEPIFMRIPTAEELERYEAAKRQAFRANEPELIRQREAQMRRQAEARAEGREFNDEIPPVPSLETFNFSYGEVLNVQNVDRRHAIVRGRPESTYLVEVIPGDYVLYGASYGNWAVVPSLFACMCLGTVGFSVQAGTVTDLGYFFGDSVHEVSELPELADESGFGPSSYGYVLPLGATVRPPRADSSVPEALRSTAIQPVQYRAVGKYFDPRAITINRLAPIPGILAYDGGRVIDVQSGREAQGAQIE